MRPRSLPIVVLIVLLVAAVIFGHLLPGLDATEIDREIRNALHVIGFALVAAVIFEALPMRVTTAALTTLVLVAALGALAEIAQNLGGKSMDLTDLYLDIAGATLYLCARIVWQWTNAERRSPVAHFSARLVSMVLGILIFLPLGYWLSVDARIAANFPTILDFDGRWDAYLYLPIDSEVSLVKTDATSGDYDGTFAEILLLRRSWSGLKIEPVVSDWSSFQFLTMRAAIVGGYGSKVIVHISDGVHPGYRTQHRVGDRSVGQQPTTLRFPLRGVVDIPGRPDLDLSNIRDIYIIGKTKRRGEDKSEETRLILDDIRLE